MEHLTAERAAATGTEEVPPGAVEDGRRVLDVGVLPRFVQGPVVRDRERDDRGLHAIPSLPAPLRSTSSSSIRPAMVSQLWWWSSGSALAARERGQCRSTRRQ